MTSPSFQAQWDFMVEGSYSNPYPKDTSEYLEYKQAFERVEDIYYAEEARNEQ